LGVQQYDRAEKQTEARHGLAGAKESAELLRFQDYP
jgi:hypothetical protein